jgi:iron complex outermembrane receptor protein
MIYQHRDDWVDNTFTGEKNALEGYNEFAARGQLLFESDNFSGLFNLHGRNLNGTARLFRANIIKPNSGGLVSGFDRDKISIDGRNQQHLDGMGGSARLRWDFDGFSLYSVTGYETIEVFSRGDIDGGFGAVFAPPSGPGTIPFSSESADGVPDHSQWSQEFRLESRGDGPWDWQAGLFYFNEDVKIDSFSYDSLAGGVQNGYAKQHQENTAWAVFGSLGYQFNPEWKMRGGLRYTDDSKDFTGERLQSPLAFLGVGPIGPISVNPSDTDVSGDLSINFEPTDSAVNWYGRIARGFRAPSIQGRLLFGDIVSVGDSETVWSYEAGLKAKFWDNRARLGFDVFHYTVSDPQLTAVGGQTNFNQLINADELDGKRLRAGLRGLRHRAPAGHGGRELQQHRDPGQEPHGRGVRRTLPRDRPDRVVGGATLARIDGNSLPQAPEWTSNLTARWSMPMGDGGEFYIYTDWAYRSEVNFFLYESKEFRGDSLLEGGLRVGYNWDFGKYGLSLFGRNITNEEELVGGIDFNNLTGFVNEPRVWGIEFNAKW